MGADPGGHMVAIFGIMIPIVGTIATAAVLIFLIYFRQRERTKLHDTLRALAETDSPHQETLMGVLTRTAEPVPERDLRQAITMFSVALSLFALAFMIGLMNDDGYMVIWPLVAVAVFPFSYGVGRVLLWRLAVKRGDA